MRFFVINPQVAGEIANESVEDVSIHPPIVTNLHYEFEDWFGDCIVTSFPCFLVTREVQAAILEAGLTGAEFSEAKVTKSENFDILYEGPPLPEFVRLLPTGKVGKEDFGATEMAKLVVSQRALSLLKSISLTTARIEPFL